MLNICSNKTNSIPRCTFTFISHEIWKLALLQLERPHLEDCLQFFTLSSGMAHTAKRGIKHMAVREIKGPGDNGSLEKQEKVQGLYASWESGTCSRISMRWHEVQRSLSEWLWSWKEPVLNEEAKNSGSISLQDSEYCVSDEAVNIITRKAIQKVWQLAGGHRH